MDRRLHQEGVAAIMRAAQAAGVEDDTVVWAERVLRSRNDKPLSQKIQEVVRSAGAGGDAVLKTAPTFPSTVVDERGGVSHPGMGKSLDAANRYWNSEVLTWIAATPAWIVVAAEPITDVDTTAADMLEALNAQGISLVFADMKDPVREKIERYELTRTIDPAHFFPTVGAAVAAFQDQFGADWAPAAGKQAR